MPCIKEYWWTEQNTYKEQSEAENHRKHKSYAETYMSYRTSPRDFNMKNV